MRLEKVWFDRDFIFVKTDIGHIVGSPLEWFPRLQNATEQQRKNFTFDEDSIRWEELDEDLSLDGFFTYKVQLVRDAYSQNSNVLA